MYGDGAITSLLFVEIYVPAAGQPTTDQSEEHPDGVAMALQKQQLLLPHEVRSFEEPAEENGTPWSGSATGAECAPTVCTYVHVDVFVSTTNVIGVSTMPRQRARSSMASSASSKRCWKGRLVHLLYHRRCRTKPLFRHEAFVCHSEGNGDAERHPLRGQIWVASNLGCK